MEPGVDIERLLIELARWGSAERVGTAARSRQRERWARQQAVEDARLTGVALDLAERGATVAVTTGTGAAHRGVIAAVADDFWLLGTPTASTLLAVAGIVTVRTASTGVGDLPTGDRQHGLDLRMADALAALAAERPRVKLGLGPAQRSLVGELCAVGADVLTLRVDGDPAATVYVALSSVIECSILGSG